MGRGLKSEGDFGDWLEKRGRRVEKRGEGRKEEEV